MSQALCACVTTVDETTHWLEAWSNHGPQAVIPAREGLIRLQLLNCQGNSVTLYLGAQIHTCRNVTNSICRRLGFQVGTAAVPLVVKVYQMWPVRQTSKPAQYQRP